MHLAAAVAYFVHVLVSFCVQLYRFGCQTGAAGFIIIIMLPINRRSWLVSFLFFCFEFACCHLRFVWRASPDLHTCLHSVIKCDHTHVSIHWASRCG
jgi:hypothetical protein